MPPVDGGLPGGDPGMGAPPMPMGGPMGGPPPPPAGPQGAPTDPSQRPPVPGPLNSMAKVLYDYNINFEVGNSQGDDPEELALKVWVAYGGNEMGGADPDKVGKRTDEDAKRQPDAVEKERSRNDSSKWERLPAGATVNKVFTLEELNKLMSSIVFGASKQAAPPPPAGGMPMAGEIAKWLRLASVCDSHGQYELADRADVKLAAVTRLAV